MVERAMNKVIAAIDDFESDLAEIVQYQDEPVEDWE